MERRFNGRRSLAIQSKTGLGQTITAYSLLYSALNVIDKKATNTNDLANFRELYFQATDHLSNRFLPRAKGADKRTLLRAISTIENRLNAITKRFNKLVEDGAIQGAKVNSF